MNWKKYIESQMYFLIGSFIGLLFCAFLFAGIIEFFKGSDEEFNWYSC